MNGGSIFPHPSRRRVLSLLAASAATILQGPAALAETLEMRWRGRVFGTDASITIRDPDRKRASDALQSCVTEIERIERIFSLYRRDSLVVQLNRAGMLVDPPTELVDVLSFVEQISRLSDGAFDVTVQPLWGVHIRAQRFSRSPSRSFAEALEEVRTRIGWRHLAISSGHLAFAIPDMAVTLNGIAPGYATDRIAERLRAHGFPNVLVNVGEYRGLGGRAEGEPWRIGVAAPDGSAHGFQLVAAVPLFDGAVATSSPMATPLSVSGEHHHLFDPHTARSAVGWDSVSVVAPTAMQADALSTAIAVAPKAAAEVILDQGGGWEAFLTDGDRHIRIVA